MTDGKPLLYTLWCKIFNFLFSVLTVGCVLIYIYHLGGAEKEAWEYMAVCVPIVVFCAPIGSLIASHFHRQCMYDITLSL